MTASQNDRQWHQGKQDPDPLEGESQKETEHIPKGILFTSSLQRTWGNRAVTEAIQRQAALTKHTHPDPRLSPQCDCPLRSLEAETQLDPFFYKKVTSLRRGPVEFEDLKLFITPECSYWGLNLVVGCIPQALGSPLTPVPKVLKLSTKTFLVLNPMYLICSLEHEV